MSPSDRIQALLDRKSRELWSVAPENTVFDAITVMSDREIGALPVVEDGELIGMLSERDYARKVILQGRSSRDTTVADIMTSPVITIAPHEQVADAMRLMTEHRIRHLPVVVRGKICGIVSIGDLVNWIISAHEEEIANLRTYIAGGYPA